MLSLLVLTIYLKPIAAVENGDTPPDPYKDPVGYAAWLARTVADELYSFFMKTVVEFFKAIGGGIWTGLNSIAEGVIKQAKDFIAIAIVKAQQLQTWMTTMPSGVAVGLSITIGVVVAIYLYVATHPEMWAALKGGL